MTVESVTKLTALARMRIASGQLPCIVLPTVWAEAGAKEKCSLCHGVILPLETVYEVNVKPQEGVEPQVLHFHLECHSAWTMACMEAPVDSTGSN